MEDLIRANALSRLDSRLDSAKRAARLVTSEDEMEESFDEEVSDIEKPDDDSEDGNDMDMSNWEN